MELLVVIVIIAILASLSVHVLSSTRVDDGLAKSENRQRSAIGKLLSTPPAQP
ncbi:MAG: hypothetical protein HY043_21200 [Verrucomicrobia bacterium]|nr:hypothetical protein [Verrucomicrobiota bacterium]